jgi:hypothetical protein
MGVAAVSKSQRLADTLGGKRVMTDSSLRKLGKRGLTTAEEGGKSRGDSGARMFSSGPTEDKEPAIQQDLPQRQLLQGSGGHPSPGLSQRRK